MNCGHDILQIFTSLTKFNIDATRWVPGGRKSGDFEEIARSFRDIHSVVVYSRVQECLLKNTQLRSVRLPQSVETRQFRHKFRYGWIEWLMGISKILLLTEVCWHKSEIRRSIVDEGENFFLPNIKIFFLLFFFSPLYGRYAFFCLFFTIPYG